MTTKMENYLRALGLVTGKDTIRHEHLAIALEILRDTGVSNKAHNRYTGTVDTLASLMADAIGKPRGYVTKEMAVWLDRFRLAYNADDPLFASICEPKMVKILTPWQLLYLVSLDFYQSQGA